MRVLSDELLRICAVALGLAPEHFTAHTDFGTVTVPDREPSDDGLQVYTKDGEWVAAPYDPSALRV